MYFIVYSWYTIKNNVNNMLYNLWFHYDREYLTLTRRYTVLIRNNQKICGIYPPLQPWLSCCKIKRFPHVHGGTVQIIYIMHSGLVRQRKQHWTTDIRVGRSKGEHRPDVFERVSKSQHSNDRLGRRVQDRPQRFVPKRFVCPDCRTSKSVNGPFKRSTSVKLKPHLVYDSFVSVRNNHR